MRVPEDMAHFWCEICGEIQPVVFDKTPAEDVSGEFMGRDIVCEECNFIIATFYSPKVVK